MTGIASKAAKQALLSNRGVHSQSMDPSRATNAMVFAIADDGSLR